VSPVASARPAVQVPDLQQAVADILEHDAQRTAYIDALVQHGERAARELEHERQEAGKLRARVAELEALTRESVAHYDGMELEDEDCTLWRERVALGLDGATGHRDVNAEVAGG
jgi:hypothetical protein